MELNEISSYTLQEIKGKCNIVLSFGSIEAHSRHLPMGTDTIILEALIKSLPNTLQSELLFTPFIHFTPINNVRTRGEDGVNNINIDFNKWVEHIEDLVSNIITTYQPRQLLLITWHDTFDFISSLRRICFKIHEKYNLFIDALRVWEYALEYAKVKNYVDSKERHAALIETSLLLYLKPSLVKEEFIKDGVWSKRNMLAVDWDSYNDLGIYGQASQANSELGKEIFAEVLTNLEKFIVEYFSIIQRSVNG